MSLKVLLVSSGGGHAVQARLLKSAFTGYDVEHLVARDEGGALSECSLKTLWKVPTCLVKAARFLRKMRPDIVVSTGALPGLLTIFAARFFGAQTIWVDSVANARTLSISGRAARWIAHNSYSQWPDVAENSSVKYAGAVI